MSVRVWQSCPPNNDGMWADWEMKCSTHPETSPVTSPDWTWAMEAAWGHIAMHHHQSRREPAQSPATVTVDPSYTREVLGRQIGENEEST